ncbi:hypothetical protein C4900_13845 [Acidiferrobacter thiooxydans]|uniref:Uncharacterized protein n=1 Tax=Acidiferrobacter thiooxydans TaxID=163359 RepID=A0A368HHR8_9GAMM|nr:hypothetical protein C4900_13845 [Acidiferrobacter thiooxydans]
MRSRAAASAAGPAKRLRLASLQGLLRRATEIVRGVGILCSAMPMTMRVRVLADIPFMEMAQAKACA